MSGWFGTSNRDTNNALDGIRAGHVRRRNMQRQRYDSGLFGRGLGQHAEGHILTHSEMYRGFALTFKHVPLLGKHVTTAWRADKSFTETGVSRGEATNKVKNNIDQFVGDDDNDVIPNGGNNGGNNEFTPVAMPNNYVNGGYQVISFYNGMTQKYKVTVYTPGGGVGETVNFAKTEGIAAVTKHNKFIWMVDRQVVYDAEIPLTADKNPYTVKLIVEAETALSGFFSGLFGLGNWAARPARTFRVVVQKLDTDGLYLVTNYDSGNMAEYESAKAEFDNQVSLVENNFYAESDPLIPEVPTNDGDGGDLTNDTALEQAAAELAAALLAEQAAAQLALQQSDNAYLAELALMEQQEANAAAALLAEQEAAQLALQNESYAAAEAAAAAAAQTVADGESIMQYAENYNQMVARQEPVLINRDEPTYETQTATRTGGSHNHITADIGLTLAALGLVGMVYLAVKDQ